ncbi:hypothetical protein [Pseudoxanthomonas suwonensis]|uniref:hypothetical protein n=1 Tax=Pseudoxanthomonas suwonensis TaxID=314722 RepID=UPI000AD7C3A2|nr:hypothetical protein [Pseudoxanthomonas suwonensis]
METEPTHQESRAEEKAQRRTDRLEMLFTLVMAMAAIGTAWAGFESAKWGGVQSRLTTEASAARIEANRKSNEAWQQRTVDVITFTQWLGALNAELQDDPAAHEAGYAPRERTLSAFIHARFRDEFKPAFEAWMAYRPLRNPDAPATPFVMPEYRLAAQDEADRLSERAEQRGTEALAASTLSDNYVLTGVLFALVLFFVAVGNKANSRRSRWLLFGLSLVTFAATLGVLATFPVVI